MAFQVQCKCGAKIKVKDELKGRTAKCPTCKEKLVLNPVQSQPKVSPAKKTVTAPPASKPVIAVPVSDDQIETDHYKDASGKCKYCGSLASGAPGPQNSKWDTSKENLQTPVKRSWVIFLIILIAAIGSFWSSTHYFVSPLLMLSLGFVLLLIAI